jgi:Tfp pilus assembly protein PilV
LRVMALQCANHTQNHLDWSQREKQPQQQQRTGQGLWRLEAGHFSSLPCVVATSTTAMSRRNKNARKRLAAKKGASPTALSQMTSSNYIDAAAPGCVVIHDDGSRRPCRWLIDAEPLDLSLFAADNSDDDVTSIPDILFDHDDGTLSLVNSDASRLLSFYVSVAHPCVDVDGKPLPVCGSISHIDR